MRELVCIVCPNSCHITIEEKDGQWKVSGNKCRRGEAFAIDEVTCPKRTFSTTVKTKWPEVPVVPVRVSAEIPKDKIFDIMNLLNKMTIETPVGRGDVIIANVMGLSADVIVTSDCLKTYLEEEN